MARIPVSDAIRIIPREDSFLNRKLGSRGEIFFDRASNTLRLYDGVVVGGISLAKTDLANVGTTAFRAKSVESRLATVIYTVTISAPLAPDVGNKYVLNGVYRPIPNFVVGYTYVFNQDDATNVYFPNASGTTVNPHPLNFSADNLSGEQGGGTSYLADVRYLLNGAAVTQAVYNSSAFNTATARQVQITITNATPATLYYWCYNHIAMGNATAVADPGSGTGSSLAAGPGISIDDDSTEKIITNSGVLGIVAGSGITTTINQGVVTINSVANTGNVTFTGRTVDSDDSTAITFTPSVIFDSDVAVYELVFPDGSRQVSAAGPTPGPQGAQGLQGPSGPVGSGAGDVVSLAAPVTDNAIVRYHEATGTIIQNSTATLSDAGILTAAAFSGGGTNITGLDAANLASGTVPDARFPATLPAASGTNLTALNATNLGSGTVPDARFPATLPAASGTNLTALNATNLGSGTVPDARFPATLPAASGVNLTALNATNLGSGTVPVARLGTAGTRDATTFLRGDNTWAVVASGGGGSSDSFSTISVAGQSNVVADSATDTLTLVAGTGMTITTNAGTDTITIASTVAAGATAFTGLSDRSDLTVDQFYLPAITRLNVTANSTSAYRFDQYGTADNPTIYAVSGTTIAFNLSGANNHPFLIKFAGSNYNTGLVHVTTGGTVTTGASAQGKQSGTLYWKLPHNISGTYGYLCQSHGGMAGTITVKDIASI